MPVWPKETVGSCSGGIRKKANGLFKYLILFGKKLKIAGGLNVPKIRGRKTRLDLALVDRGLADSIEVAQALIMAGKVIVDEQRQDKPGLQVRAGTSVRVKDVSRYVSRGGDKLAAALNDFGLAEEVRGKVVLDAGASTGGFTDCCLELGATQVIAVEIGSNQLDWKLRQDPRVTLLEHTDIRNFDATAHPAVGMVVADISFSSLASLVPALRLAAPAPGVIFVVLVKPQFELSPEHIPKGGVVADPVQRQAAAQQVMAAFAAIGFPAGISIDSRLSGRAGNQEIFYYVRAP